MKELFLILASSVPLDSLIAKMEDAIKEYKATKSDDSKKQLASIAIMISTNVTYEGKDVAEIIASTKEAGAEKGETPDNTK